MNALLLAILGTLSLATPHDEISDSTTVGEILALGGTGSSVTNAANFAIARYDTTNLTPRISAKQDALVSGVSIKTINHESILGSGNIDVSGGSGGVTKAYVDGATNATLAAAKAYTDEHGGAYDPTPLRGYALTNVAASVSSTDFAWIAASNCWSGTVVSGAVSRISVTAASGVQIHSVLLDVLSLTIGGVGTTLKYEVVTNGNAASINFTAQAATWVEVRNITARRILFGNPDRVTDLWTHQFTLRDDLGRFTLAKLRPWVQSEINAKKANDWSTYPARSAVQMGYQQMIMGATNSSTLTAWSLRSDATLTNRLTITHGGIDSVVISPTGGYVANGEEVYHLTDVNPAANYVMLTFNAAGFTDFNITNVYVRYTADLNPSGRVWREIPFEYAGAIGTTNYIYVARQGQSGFYSLVYGPSEVIVDVRGEVREHGVSILGSAKAYCDSLTYDKVTRAEVAAAIESHRAERLWNETETLDASGNLRNVAFERGGHWQYVCTNNNENIRMVYQGFTGGCHSWKALSNVYGNLLMEYYPERTYPWNLGFRIGDYRPRWNFPLHLNPVADGGFPATNLAFEVWGQHMSAAFVPQAMNEFDITNRLVRVSEMPEYVAAAKAGMQTQLVAGANITIVGNVISAAGGGQSGITEAKALQLINDMVGPTNEVVHTAQLTAATNAVAESVVGRAVAEAVPAAVAAATDFPTALTNSAIVSFHRGMLVQTIPANAQLTMVTNRWPDGEAMFAVFNPLGTFSVDTNLITIVSGDIPTNRQQAAVWRIGERGYINFIGAAGLSDKEAGR